MDFVTPIITPVVESLLVPIKKHLGFLVSSSNYVRDMQVRMRELNSTAHDMKKRKEENDAKNLVVPQHVPGWLEEVEVTNKKVGSIPTGGNVCFNMKTRYRAGKQCFDVIKDIERLVGEKSKMEWTNEQIPLGMVSSTMPSTSEAVEDVTQNIFKSRQLIFKSALEFLEPNNTTQKMALCGMGGIGKTTMMEQLKKVVEDRKLFDWVERVVMGKNTDPIAFQEAIAQYTGGHLIEATKEARADRLKERFLGMSQNGTKKILLILDDLWNLVDLKDIGLGSPLPKGFKLLLTSRDEKVCSQMGVDTSSILRMVGLEEPEAKELFWETTGLSDGDAVDHRLHKLGEDIVNRCGGLPMAIKTIALALRGEIMDAWRLTLLRLQRHNLQDLYAVVHDIFEISYYYLRNDDFKEIFLLSGLFPDDFDIPLEDLMRYGWGLKLFTKVYSLVEARQLTNTSVHNLIRANLLVESDRIGCVKMHDLARSFVLSNISKFKQASIVNHNDMSEWPTQDTRESCERILLKCKGMSEFPRHFDYPDLKLLKLMMNEKEPLTFPEDFYTRMEKLQVISYHSIQYPSLPISFQCSTNLRMLCLRSCSLMGDLSFIGHLTSLEILSFAYCRIKKLPSTMGNLRNLKLLDLTGCDELCIGDGVFENLENLEELYMRNLDYKVVNFTEDNCKGLEMLSTKLKALEVEFFENILRPNNVSFRQLERFRISIGCHLDYIYDNDVYSYENTFKLVASCEEVHAFEINELFEKTEKLHLLVEDINHLEDVSTHPSQYSFCNLKHLCFEKCANLKYLFTVDVAISLTNLERLTVSSCRVVESLIHAEISGAEVIKFPKLKRLVLDELPMFVSLCDNINIVTELPQLLELKLACLPKFTSIFASNSDIPASTRPLLNKEVMIPKLEELEIRGMKNLKEIWACGEEEDDTTPVLKEIEVDECDGMVNLFPSNPMRLLGHLEKLLVQNCGSIQVLFDIDLECVGQVNSSLRSVRALCLEKLREVWRIRGGEDNSGLLVRDFQAVEFIEVNECENFRNIVTPTTVKFDMGALIDITIDSSGEKSGTNVENIQAEMQSEILEVEDNLPPPVAAFPSFPIHTCRRLRNIKLCQFKQVEVIFDIQTPSSAELVTPNNNQPPLLLPYLTDIKLIHMNRMTHLWKCNWNEFLTLHQYQPQSSFQNLTTIYMKNCGIIDYLFSPFMAKMFSNLKKIGIHDCKRIQEVVSNREDEDDQESTTFESTHTTTVLFPRLDCLTLHNLKNLNHIGGGIPKDTTNIMSDEFKVSQVRFVSWSLCQYSREINISSCNALSTVIPSYAAGQLQKIEVMKIYECNSIKEVFETQEFNKSTNFGRRSGGTDDFMLAIRRLNSITMHNMPNLKILDIKECHRLENIFTFSMLESLMLLEMLSVQDCDALKVIVREENGEQTITSKVVIFPCLKSIKLTNLPNLRGFFSSEFNNSSNFGEGSDCTDDSTLGIPGLKSITMHKMPNLKILDINTCHRLENIFTFSTLESLRRLEMLSVQHCDELKVIVREENRGQTTASKVVIFPCLKSINLVKLPNLKGFIFGMYEFQWPLLDEVIIQDCSQMMVFTSLQSTAPKLKFIETGSARYNPECCNFYSMTTLPQTRSQSLDVTRSSTTISEGLLLSSHHMIQMIIRSNWGRRVIFSYDELLQLQNLDYIYASSCKSVEEVFDTRTGVMDSNASQTVVQLQKLRDVTLRSLTSLWYIWKSNGRTILEFPNLTKLSIYDCVRLEHVFTCSIVGSLLQLKELSISFCPGMEVIVKEDQDEEEGDDGNVSEIRLPCLKSIYLSHLKSLKGFCLGNEDYSLPSLDSMEIYGCPSLTTFSKGRLIVPELEVLQTSLGSINLAEEQDINSFIITKIQEGFHFGYQYQIRM